MKTMIISKEEVRDFLPQMIEHFTTLSSDDQYFRFFHLVSPAPIRDWLLSIDNSDTFFVVSVIKDKFIGVCQVSCFGHQGEIAISVSPEHRGIGLAGHLIWIAKNLAWKSGLSELIFFCNSNNKICKSLFSGLGFSLEYKDGEIVGSLKRETV